MKYAKATFEHLITIVLDGKTDSDVADRLTTDLSESTSCPKTLMKLCQSALKRADKAGYKQIEHAIEFVLGISKKLIDEGNKNDSQMIKELLLSDSVISKCYYTLSEKLKYVDDLDSAEKVIRRKFELLKEEVGKNSYTHVMTVEKDGTVERDEFRNPCIHDFTKLAYVYQDICGKSDTFPKDVVEFAVSSIKCEWFVEIVELGEWYSHIGDYTKAIECFRRAEVLLKDFDDYFILCHNLFGMKCDRGDVRDYAMQIMLKAIHFVKDSNIDCAERYVRLAEVCANVNGICDHRLTLELLKAGQRSCVNLKQLKNVKEIVQEISDQWDEQEREKSNG